jgi:hypothetical protein
MLPADTCPCTFLMFNMDSLQAHVHFQVSGLEALKDASTERMPSLILTDTSVRITGRSSEDLKTLTIIAILASVLVLILVLNRRFKLPHPSFMFHENT